MKNENKIPELEQLATDLVADGKDPDLFFVSFADSGVIAVCRNHADAYRIWNDLPKNVESSLENRKWGIICGVEPQDDTANARLIVVDDMEMFLKYQKMPNGKGAAH